MRSPLALPFLLLILAPTSQAAPLSALRAPDKTRWTVTVTAGDSEPRPEGRRIVESIGEKENDVYRVINRYAGGDSEEYWIFPQIQFLKSGESKNIVRLLPDDSSALDLTESDFPELYWATGLEPRPVEIEGVRYLLVELEGSKMRLTRRQQRDHDETRRFLEEASSEQQEEKKPARPPNAPQMLRLLLDPATGLPVRFTEDATVWNYRFEPSAGLRNAPSPEFGAAIQSWIQRRSALMRPPTPPKVRVSKE